MYPSLSFARNALVVGALCLLLTACSDSSSPTSDAGRDATADTTTTTGDSTADQGGQDGKSDAFVAAHEHTLQYGSGLPALRLTNIGGSPVMHIEPPAAHGFVQVRKLAVKVYDTVKLTAIVQTWSGLENDPPRAIAEKEHTVTAAEVGKWVEIDLSDKNIVLGGPFYVGIRYQLGGGKIGPAVTASSSLKTVQLNRGGLLTKSDPNFDYLMRVTYAASAGAAQATPKSDGASCVHASECTGGYCVGGACTSACPSSGSCTSGRCATFGDGTKVCVPDCSKGQACPAGSFCLARKVTAPQYFKEPFDPAGICTRVGDRVDGADCTGEYDTVCKSGRCSACDNAADCQASGTCQPRSSGDGGGGTSDGGGGGARDGGTSG